MSKKHKKCSLTEDHMFTLLQRYTPTTVLELLREVYRVSDAKIDWNELVKNTTTGISNAREYHMLWRHLAYSHELLDDNGAHPLDDDSDLEYELEALPTVSSEASAEAAAYVKVHIASGLPNDSSLPNGSTIEAPLIINTPNGQPSRTPSDNPQLGSFKQGTNITIPVFVQKLPHTAGISGEGLETNGTVSGSLPARRKRKPWSDEEDMELIAAVQKCGEGNWANILKGDFKGERTASQLSQRWAIIRKRKGNLNIGGGSQLSEAQLAARRAVSLAIAMPMVDNLKTTSISTSVTNSSIAPCNSTHPTAAEASSFGTQSQRQSQQGSVQPVAHRSVTSGSLSKSRVTSKKPSIKFNLSPDSLVKAAAVAAGARIATPSDAASLLKAVQAKNAVHIIPGGSSLIKSSMAGNVNPLPSSHLGPHPNVHYIRTGLAAAHSTYSAVPPNSSRPGGTQQVQVHSVKSATLTVELNPTSNGSELNASSEATNVVTSISSTIEPDVKMVENTMSVSVNELKDDQADVAGCAPTQLVQEDQITISGSVPKEQVQEDQAAFSGNAPDQQVREYQSSVLGNALKEQIQEDQASVLSDDPNKQVNENQITFPSSELILKNQEFKLGSVNSSSAEMAANDDSMMRLDVKIGGENHSAIKEICGNHIENGGKQEDLTSMVVDGNDGIVELPSKEAA